MTRTRTSSRPSVRDRILATASDLFYKEGVQNVGIDRIIAESGVAKMSLYNHFKSKDALIAVWLQEQHKSWRIWFQRTVERYARKTGELPVLAIFDVLKEWAEKPDFRGCAFINSAVELVDPEHPGYQVSLEHQQAIFDYILSLVKGTGLPNPENLTEQLVILMQGATVVAMMQHQDKADVAMQAKAAAVTLVSDARRQGGEVVNLSTEVKAKLG
jgi:AcrR family transcriptional regulator